MPIDFEADNIYNYIATFQRLEDILPYKQYSSGAKTEDNTIYSDKSPANTNPVLLLEYDILNKPMKDIFIPKRKKSRHPVVSDIQNKIKGIE